MAGYEVGKQWVNVSVFSEPADSGGPDNERIG